MSIHLVQGGSIGTALETNVSDLDLFLISNEPDSDPINRYISSIKGTRSLDIETMSIDRFKCLVTSLEDFKLTIDGGFSPFKFSDLRFMTRASLGKIIIKDKKTISLLASIKNQLRLAALNYISSMYIMRYQDAYGFYITKRWSEIVVIAGELVQLSNLLAMLQRELVDLSLKSSPVRARDSNYGLLPKYARNQLSLLLSIGVNDLETWSSKFLLSLNSTIAAGIVDSNSQDFTQINSKYPFNWKPEICLMGIPKCLVYADVSNNKTGIYNKSFITSYL